MIVVNLTFVVNGEEIPVDVAADAPLHTAVAEALEKSKNTARPAEESGDPLRDGRSHPGSDPARCGVQVPTRYAPLPDVACRSWR